MSVTYEDIAAAHKRIQPHVRRTPVLTSSTIDALTGARVSFKCENFQRTGAFKFRGAYNALSQLREDERRRGVIAFSTGNHAQAVALAGKMLKIKTLIVMPANAAKVKLNATRGYGAEVVLYEKSESRENIAARLSSERGLTLIRPFDHPHIIAGQGTAAKELIEDAGPLDALLVPCGGGGLLSGCAIVVRHLIPNCRVIGVEPQAGDDATQSFRRKELKVIQVPDTIADGARTPSLGKLTFALVLQYVDEMLTVSDDELLRAMSLLWERMKIVVEPTGALGACALLEKKFDPKGLRIGVILSGGNVDLAWAVRAFCAQR